MSIDSFHSERKEESDHAVDPLSELPEAVSRHLEMVRLRQVQLPHLSHVPRQASGAVRAGRIQVQQMRLRVDETGRGAGTLT
jgi:hypothetical protein